MPLGSHCLRTSVFLVALYPMAARDKAFPAPAPHLSCRCGSFLLATQVTLGQPQASGAEALGNEEEGSLPVSLPSARSSQAQPQSSTTCSLISRKTLTRWPSRFFFMALLPLRRRRQESNACLAKGYSEIFALPLQWTGLCSRVNPHLSGHLSHRTRSQAAPGPLPQLGRTSPDASGLQLTFKLGPWFPLTVTTILINCSVRKAKLEAMGVNESREIFSE